MTPDLPLITTEAPPRRHPLHGYRVRWHHPDWKLDADGNPCWSRRWFTRERAALRYARKLLELGYAVELDTYKLDHQHSVRWVADDDLGPFA